MADNEENSYAEDEEKAERAKEFLSTLNRRRPSRKRYSVGSRAAVSRGECKQKFYTANMKII